MGAHESPSGAELVDADGVVRIGSVVFALIRPTAGHELAFNHWYERDHYYTTGLAAPGVFSAGRFVQPESGWHLALYFVLPGFDAARVAFASQATAVAASNDRLFSEREHLHTWTYDVESSTRAADGVALALALDHRYDSITVGFYDDAPPVGPGPSLHLRPRERVMPSEWDGDIDVTRRRVVLGFGAGASCEGASWSADFVPVVFGTDTHIASAPR